METTKNGDREIEFDSARPSLRHSSWAFTLAKIVLTALAVGFVIFKVDLSAAWSRTAEQDIWLILPAAGVIMAQIIVAGLRWHVILRYLDAPAVLKDTLRLYYIAVFFNNCLWGAVAGDFVRGWLSYRARVSARTAAMSIILDRIAGLAAIAILVLVTAPAFVPKVGNPTIALVPSVMASAGLLGIVVLAQFDWLLLRWQRLRVVRYFQMLGGATRKIFLRPAAALSALLLAVISQALLGFATYLVAASLRIELSMLDCIVLMQPVVLVTALPISVGGWGVRETAMIVFLGIAGVPPSAALILSIQLGVLGMLVSLPGLLLWLTVKSKSGAPEATTPMVISS